MNKLPRACCFAFEGPIESNLVLTIATERDEPAVRQTPAPDISMHCGIATTTSGKAGRPPQRAYHGAAPCAPAVLPPEDIRSLPWRLSTTPALLELFAKARAMRSTNIYRQTQTLLVAMLLCAASPVWPLELQQQNFSDNEIFSAVVARFQKSLSHRFNPAPTGDPKPLLVLGPALKFGKKMTAPSFTHLTQQELVEQQQAVFILVTKAYPDPERSALYVEYDTPANASFGVLKVYPKDGVLVTEVKDSFRSSSGARATYGKLYEGVACRDNTEMAYRWNYYERRGSGGRCLDTMFTEFTGWFDPSVKPPAK